MKQYSVNKIKEFKFIMKQYSVNKINEKTYQIMGEVNGNVYKHYHEGVWAFEFNINFFVGKTQIKINTSSHDNTMRTIEDVKLRIDKIVQESINEYS